MKLLADLHVHSRASADGRSSVEALIEAAKARSLAAITVSDHDLCTPLPERPDVLLIPGVEITSANGHILGLFLERPIDFSALGRYPAPEKAIVKRHRRLVLCVRWKFTCGCVFRGSRKWPQ